MKIEVTDAVLTFGAFGAVEAEVRGSWQATTLPSAIFFDRGDGFRVAAVIETDSSLGSPQGRCSARLPLLSLARFQSILCDAQFSDGSVERCTVPIELQFPETAPMLADFSIFGGSSARAAVRSMCEIGLNALIGAIPETFSGGLTFPQNPHPARVSVVIPVHREASFTWGCLFALQAQRSDGLEVIVVDNDSDSTTKTLLSRVPGLTILRNDENRSFADACNQGAKAARGEFLLFLNNDAFVLPGAIEHALAASGRSPMIGAVGARLLRCDGRMQEVGAFCLPNGTTVARGRGVSPWSQTYSLPMAVDYVSAAFLLVRRELFESVGGFDPRYNPAYYEDADLCRRLASRGYETVVEPKAVVLHIERGSSSDEAATDQALAKNRHLFTQTHGAVKSVVSLVALPLDRRKRLLFIDDAVPAASAGQGQGRAVEMIEVLRRLGFQVVIHPMGESSGAKLGPQIEALRRMVDDFGIILVSRPHHMETLQTALRVPPSRIGTVPIVYDAEALHARREILRAALVDDRDIPEKDLIGILSAEVVLARDADVVLTVNGDEAETFRDFGWQNVSVVSHGVDIQPTAAPFEARHGLLTVGPLLDPSAPNVDGIRWFVERVIPWLKRFMPTGLNPPLHAVGENRLQTITNLESELFRALGYVEDLTPLYDSYRVFVAPTRFSAGIPLKVIEAAARGIPIVGTALVASQLGWTDEQEMLIARDEREFAAKIAAVYVNQDLWQSLRDAALERVRNDFSREKFANSLKNALGELIPPER
jgi:GT2 family glycosyltransferase/glycosyltransferase involved in cell wall biosynthesis